MIELNLISARKINLLKKSAIIRHSLNSGITLVEVIIAAAFSFLVIGGAAFGMMTMMQRNSTLETRSMRRMDLERAINYIANDIRSANGVTTVCSSKSGTCVLSLTIPSANVDYLIKSPDPSDPSNPWSGPYIINRSKTNASVLVDGIDTPDANTLTKIQTSCGTTTTKTTTTTTNNQDTTTTTTTTTTTFSGANGFYACIKQTTIDTTTTTTTTATVDLYLYGKSDPTLTPPNLAVNTTVSTLKLTQQKP